MVWIILLNDQHLPEFLVLSMLKRLCFKGLDIHILDCNCSDCNRYDPADRHSRSSWFWCIITPLYSIECRHATKYTHTKENHRISPEVYVAICFTMHIKCCQPLTKRGSSMATFHRFAKKCESPKIYVMQGLGKSHYKCMVNFVPDVLLTNTICFDMKHIVHGSKDHDV